MTETSGLTMQSGCYTLLLFLLMSVQALAQTQYQFTMKENLESIQDANTTLNLLPNDLNQTGSFGSLIIPSSTCVDGGESSGYFFEDNAGVSFSNNGFITSQFTIQCTFKINELLVRNGRTTDWVQLVEFGNDGQDQGLYLIIDKATEGSATLNYWQFSGGTGSSVRIGIANFFNTTDLYQITIRRNVFDVLDVFINGSLFEAGYLDSEQIYLPATSDEINFFRDLPTSVLDDEASSGWVKDILISNQSWADEEVGTRWNVFCNKLVDFDFEVANTCLGDQTLFTPLVDVSTADSIVWNFGDATSNDRSTDEQPTYVFNGAGTFVVEAGVYHQGISTPYQEEVQILAGPTVILEEAQEVVIGTLVELVANATDAISYLWSDGSSESSIQVSSDIVGMEDYWVEVDDALGCSAIDTVSITYTEWPELVVPNTFTPNGDGINDTWVIENIKSIPNRDIKIFDRLGSLRHALHDYQNNWDGTVGGEQLSQGTYYYFILTDQKLISRGSITILL